MDQQYILALVSIVQQSRAELTPREKKIVSRVTANSSREAAKTRSENNNNDRSSAKGNKNSKKANEKQQQQQPKRITAKLVIEDSETESETDQLEFALREMNLDGGSDSETNDSNTNLQLDRVVSKCDSDSSLLSATDCLPLKCLENRISSKRGDVAFARGQLEEAEDIFRAGLARYRALVLAAETAGAGVGHRHGKEYEMDQMALLYNLGRVSLAKGTEAAEAARRCAFRLFLCSFFFFFAFC
jgi:hypothetical protein